MGFYITIENSTARIRAQNLDEAYRLMCALNDPKNNHLKGGGSYSAGKQREYWYSWMPADYDKTCVDARSILEELGFDCYIGESGDLYIESYDSKCGDEEIFFETIAHLVEGDIDWRGEDGSHWRWNFSSGKLKHQTAKIIYED